MHCNIIQVTASVPVTLSVEEHLNCRVILEKKLASWKIIQQHLAGFAGKVWDAALSGSYEQATFIENWIYSMVIMTCWMYCNE